MIPFNLDQRRISVNVTAFHQFKLQLSVSHRAWCTMVHHITCDHVAIIRTSAHMRIQTIHELHRHHVKMMLNVIKFKTSKNPSSDRWPSKAAMLIQKMKLILKHSAVYGTSIQYLVHRQRMIPPQTSTIIKFIYSLIPAVSYFTF